MKTHRFPFPGAETFLAAIVTFGYRIGCEAMHNICSGDGKYGIRVTQQKVSKAA